MNFENFNFEICFFEKTRKYDKTRVNFKPFGEEISQKLNRLHIYDLNLLKFVFFYF
jgi:hypothetical protein